MRVIQVLDALDFGDGVSNDVIHLHEMLDELQVENYIYSKWCHEKVQHYTNDIEKCNPKEDDLVLYHFSGKSFICDIVTSFPCKVIIRYHNITPPSFFKKSNPEGYRSCMEGLEQIAALMKKIPYVWGDSQFNCSDLISYGAKPANMRVLPIFMNLERLASAPSDEKLDCALKQGEKYILFVGRVVPNKCFEDILDLFECYYRFHNSATKLILVGNDACDQDYAREIKEKLDQLSCKQQVIFTGKVSDSQLYTYYRNATAFVCMSEHEGFCIPLLEAMYFHIPVIGYDSCAVPDTMGKSGVLVYKKDPAKIASLLNEICTDENLRSCIIAAQNKNVEYYLHDSMKEQLKQLLSEGENW